MLVERDHLARPARPLQWSASFGGAAGMRARYARWAVSSGSARTGSGPTSAVASARHSPRGPLTGAFPLDNPVEVCTLQTSQIARGST